MNRDLERDERGINDMLKECVDAEADGNPAGEFYIEALMMAKGWLAELHTLRQRVVALEAGLEEAWEYSPHHPLCRTTFEPGNEFHGPCSCFKESLRSLLTPSEKGA